MSDQVYKAGKCDLIISTIIVSRFKFLLRLAVLWGKLTETSLVPVCSPPGQIAVFRY